MQPCRPILKQHLSAWADFWGIESQFGMIKGVIRTRVGYAGGQSVSPTYSNIGDHTETVQVDYDPDVITYDQLLDIFWKSHKPTGWNWAIHERSLLSQ